ncbi:MAG: hypothetical protein JO330_15570 [Mycobacteriaceae bacterium]|nr:hypothetical protein [Mycobacteriaceae bacterium]
MRYRLDVVAPSVTEAVTFAGGWLFDRVMAGWDVTVLLAEHSDGRPLQILGVDALDLEQALASWGRRPRPQSLAVATDLFDRDSRIRLGVLKALDHGGTEVTLWGRKWPPELDKSIDSVQHRLSAAARAFKDQALAAAAVRDVAVEPTETFGAGLTTCSSVAADLTPAS